LHRSAKREFMPSNAHSENLQISNDMPKEKGG